MCRLLIWTIIWMFCSLPSQSAVQYSQFGFKNLQTINQSAPQRFQQICDCLSPCYVVSIYVSSATTIGGSCLLSVTTQRGESLLANHTIDVGHIPNGSSYVLLPLSELRELQAGDVITVNVKLVKGSFPLDLSVGIDTELHE